MTDADAYANTIASRYIELWNEKAPNRRRDILAANWASNATYIDPMMRSDGHDGIDAMIAGVQQRFPEFTFTLIGQPNGYGDQVRLAHVRFSRGLGPMGVDSPIKGTDFAVVRDGRIQSVTGFSRSDPIERVKTQLSAKQSRANPKVDAAMKLLLPGAPDPEQVTPRGALRSMQRYRLHLGF